MNNQQLVDLIKYEIAYWAFLIMGTQNAIAERWGAVVLCVAFSLFVCYLQFKLEKAIEAEE